MPDAYMAVGVGSGMLPVPYDMVGVGGMLPRDAAAPIPQPIPITALASALANTSPDQQRMFSASVELTSAETESAVNTVKHIFNKHGYSPLGSPGTSFIKSDVLKSPVLASVAEKLGDTPAHVALRLQLTNGS